MGSFYRSRHELIFVFKNGKGAHRNNVMLGQYGRNRTNVWEYPWASAFSKQGDEGNLLHSHPTVKPVALVADADLSDRRGEAPAVLPSVEVAVSLQAGSRSKREPQRPEIWRPQA